MEAVGYMKEDVLQERVDDIQEIVAEAKFGDEPVRTRLMQHRIKTGDARPVRMPQYCLPHAYRELVDKELQEMGEDYQNIEQ